MGFDKDKFLEAKLVPRTKEVPLPDLKQFFGDGDEPVWIVRGLTGKELGRANEAAARNKNVAAIMEGLVSAMSAKKVESIKKLIGTTQEDTPEDVAKRLEMLVVGSVDPECDLDLALKLCTTFPIEFYQLTNEITRLTGMGHEPGKAKPSGKKEVSEQV